MAPRKPLDSLLLVGDQMSNLCFNLAQRDGQTERNKLTMRDLVSEWDHLRRVVKAEARTQTPAKKRKR